MHDLVPQYRGQLGLAAQLDQQPAVQCDLATGQGPGIGCRVVHDAELIRQLTIADLGQAITHGLQIAGEFRLDHIVAALGLAIGAIVLFAQRQFLGLGNQGDLVFPGYRIDRAAADQCLQRR